MRRLALAVAALLTAGFVSPVAAAPAVLAPAAPAVIVQSGASLTAPTMTIQATKKKKKKKAKESASITEIGTARKGKTDLEIKASVAKAGRECLLKVKWKDGSTSEDDATSDDEKVCEFSVDVPNKAGVVGEATAELTVKDASGNKVATAKKTFTVK